MKEDEIAKIVVDTCYHIHKKLGPGLLESVYEAILYHELIKRDLRVQKQVRVPIRWDNIIFDEAFRVDLMVESKVILEVKAVEKVLDVHRAQLLTYLRMSDKKLGLVTNFGGMFMKSNIKRVVNGLNIEGFDEFKNRKPHENKSHH